MPDGNPTQTDPAPGTGRSPAKLPPPRVGGEYVIAPDEPNIEITERDPGSGGPDLTERGASSSTLVGSAEPAAISTDEEVEVAGAGLTAVGRRRFGDRVMAGLTAGASSIVILVVVLVAVFLVAKSWHSIADNKGNFFGTAWSTSADDLNFGVGGLLWTTVLSSVLALLMAVPVAIGIALFITQYAPKRVASPVAAVIDLLAAIPSIIYGVWGYSVLAPHLTGVTDLLDGIPLPLFDYKGYSTGTVFDASVVLAIMILPIITAISRDVFDRTPSANIEAAWALGATKWEMIRLAVLPYGRPGVISGAMLGLGRALGETIAVLLILSKVSNFSVSIFSGGETFASKIANNASEFSTPVSTGAYIAAGLVLFVLTFVVNAAARWVVQRRKDFV